MRNRRLLQFLRKPTRKWKASDENLHCNPKKKHCSERAEVEEELMAVREKLHGEQRELEKRKGLLDSRTEELQKQERMVEGNQRKISGKMAEVKQRGEQLGQMIEEQNQALHQVSGLSREEATARLLKMLEQELEQETGSIILKHEKKGIGNRRSKSTRVVAHVDSKIRRISHLGNNDQYRRYSQR